MKQYRINEIFYSLQGEGVRAGTANVFVRFTGCNMKCDIEPGPQSPGGFECDTEFTSGRTLTQDELVGGIVAAAGPCRAVIFTGGEPALQVNWDLISQLKSLNFYLAIETNGSVALPDGLDWVCCSPKVAEHAIKAKRASELKYVRHRGQGIPVPSIEADHYLISPAFVHGELDPECLAWCIQLCKENPKWRLSVQQHKSWRVR